MVKRIKLMIAANRPSRTVFLTILLGTFLLVGAGPDNATYSEKVDLKYSYAFGKNPFLPSQAQLNKDGFIAPGAFLPASYCQQCHQDAHRQWRRAAPVQSL